MGDLKELVFKSVLKAIPDLDEGEAHAVVHHLVNVLKVRNITQLKLVKEEDLTPHLSMIDARTLLEAWENKENQVPNSLQQQRPSEAEHERQALVPAQARSERGWEFAINWSDIYNISPTLHERLRKGRKLRSKEKKELINRIVLQVRNTVPQAKRDIFRQIVADMKRKYPTTFCSELAGGKLSRDSLCFKMQTRMDDAKRAKDRKTRTEMEAPSLKAAYGCVKWRTNELPRGQTNESLRKMQEELVKYYEETRPSAWNLEHITTVMNLTYGEQRSDINRQALEIENERKKLARANRNKGRRAITVPDDEEDADNFELTTTEELRSKWPFLFQPKFMMEHFNTLLQKDIAGLIQKFFENGDAEKVLTFLLETNKGRIKKIKRRMKKHAAQLPPHNAHLVALLQLLMQRFKEKEDALWIVVDAQTREDDIQDVCTIPKTPRLILAGDHVYKPKTIFFTMDGQVLGTADQLLDGIGMLFAAYYVFNLNYDPNSQITLEFFQRCILMIDPPRGNKRPSKDEGGHFCSRKIHNALAKMSEVYDDFFAEKHDSSSDSSDL